MTYYAEASKGRIQIKKKSLTLLTDCVDVRTCLTLGSPSKPSHLFVMRLEVCADMQDRPAKARSSAEAKDAASVSADSSSHSNEDQDLTSPVAKELQPKEGRERPTNEMLDVIDYWRPKNRRECIGMERPCLFVSCRFHLYLDVNPQTGSVKLNFPDKEVWQLEDTCALDIADRGGITLEDVGSIMNLTRERIRQVEVRGLQKLEGLSDDDGSLEVYVDWDPSTND